MDRITKNKRIWCAGFLDGEGCISIKKRNQNGHTQYNLKVSVTNNVIEALNIFHELYGGVIRKKSDSNCFVWEITTRGAKKVLEDLSNFLVIKKDEAKLGLEFYKNISRKKEAKYGTPQPEKKEIHERFYWLMRSMKKRANSVKLSDETIPSQATIDVEGVTVIHPLRKERDDLASIVI
jgi:hypothetical protein